MSAGRNLRLACGLLALLLVLDDARAEIHESRLRDERSLLRSPQGDLTLEFSQIKPTIDRPIFRAVMPPSGKSAWEHSSDVDLDELQAALWDEATDLDDVRVLAAYGAARQQIQTYAEAAGSPYPGDRRNAGPKPAAAVPAGLPEEFALYLRGALAYHNGDLGAARESWLTLLELPPGRRRHRSVWAAFMLGRCPPPQGVGGDWSARWFGRCREMAAGGDYTDRLGLAAASYGWEAKLHLDAGDDAAAVDLYLAQLGCGDVRAAESLAAVAHAAFAAGPDRLSRLSGSPSAAAVLAVFAACDGGPHRPAPDAGVVFAWLATLSRRVDDLRPHAARVAWAAYAVNDFATARWWEAEAPAGDARALWVRSKMHVRSGQFSEATRCLAAAAAAYRGAGAAQWDTFSALDSTYRGGAFSPADQCTAERGVVLLARGLYPEALHAFLDAGFDDGVDYVCERCFTLDELHALVDQYWGTGLPVARHGVVRSLLARRLIRANRWDIAGYYFDDPVRAVFDRYRAALRRGEDADAYAEDRADDLWEAARAAHDHGYQLFHRSSADVTDWRDERKWNSLRRRPDELHRFRAPQREENPVHYPTYVAGTLAWRAAELLPDEDDRTARVLNTAGRWYAVSDNARADQFYKALVRRCATTTLGRRADRLRWFAP